MKTKAERHLSQRDPVLARLVRELGPCTLPRRRAGDPFAALSRSIVGQMISAKAAQTVFARLCDVLDEPSPTPSRVLAAGDERLRAAGLSRTKARALCELAARVERGELDFTRLARRDAPAVGAALVDVPGIGEWTAQMFLIFHLARPDVFPARDIGVLEGMRRAYGLAERPRPAQAAELAAAWAPYRSTAAWYFWRVLDAPPLTD